MIVGYMPSGETQEPTERFIEFFQDYYWNDVHQLAQEYPDERRSLYIDYDDLFVFDRDLAEDYVLKPEQMQEYAEEAIRRYDLPGDIDLDGAHVRFQGLPSDHKRRLGEIRSDDLSELIEISGTVDSTSRIKSQVIEAAYECQRCGTITSIRQSPFGETEPLECQGCEQKGPSRSTTTNRSSRTSNERLSLNAPMARVVNSLESQSSSTSQMTSLTNSLRVKRSRSPVS